MAYPKITYNPGTGLVTLPFTYPPVSQAGVDEDGADEYDSIRTDSVTNSGKVQSVVERVDRYRTLNMTYVPNADIVAWSRFMWFASYGYTFNFFPDAGSSTSILCTLAETNWTPKFGFRGIKQFTIKLRLAELGQDAGPTGGETGTGTPPTVISFTASAAGDFDVAHDLGSALVAAVPIPTDAGVVRLQDPGWDTSNIHLNASAGGLTGVVVLFQ